MFTKEQIIDSVIKSDYEGKEHCWHALLILLGHDIDELELEVMLDALNALRCGEVKLYNHYAALVGFPTLTRTRALPYISNATKQIFENFKKEQQ